ncbi:NYN domain-containing protein [Mycoplasmopsis iners]|uniref:NYN domain-containing protein n=1 Tax=Mycoplasmopsis iners TaxID=76630 RepID=UPI00049623A6|nr:NYN domain-containing protein [Mycoplasmopsis iners]
MISDKKRVALFIDFDNFNTQDNITRVIEELKSDYDLLYSAAYFSSNLTETQKQMLVDFNINLNLVGVRIKGKNSTDINLTVDVMEQIRNDHIDGFCIASSDNDFSYLVQTLKKHGKHIIGAGDKRLNPSYINFFDHFINVSKLSNPVATKETSAEFQKLILTVNKLINQRKDNEGYADFSQVIQSLKEEMRDFSPKNYGASNRRVQSFFESADLKKHFKLKKVESAYFIKSINNLIVEETKEETKNDEKQLTVEDEIISLTNKVLSKMTELRKNETLFPFSVFFGEFVKCFPEYSAENIKKKFSKYGKTVQKIFIKMLSKSFTFAKASKELYIGLLKHNDTGVQNPKNEDKNGLLDMLKEAFSTIPEEKNGFVLFAGLGTYFKKHKINFEKFGLNKKIKAKDLNKSPLNNYVEVKKSGSTVYVKLKVN